MSTMTERRDKPEQSKPRPRNLPGYFIRSLKTCLIVLAMTSAGMARISVAQADEAQAKSLLKAMSDYLAA